MLRRLVSRGDVLVENFRTGGLARLGFDDAELARLNPALVHLAISGYGPDGPAADRPGYDFVIQAASGLMSITGAADADGGEPTKVGVAISDVVSGMLGAVSVLAALVGRERAGPGSAGQRIDVSLLGSTLASLVNQAQNAFVRGTAPGRQGNAHPNIVPYETFATADGEIAVAVGLRAAVAALLRCARPARAGRATPDSRRTATGSSTADELRPILADRLRERPTAAWLAALDAAEIPAGPIRDIVEAFASPEAVARGMTVEMEHPAWGVIRQVGVPFELSATPATIRTPPPLLGEGTDAILAELGYDDAAIAALRATAVV